MVWGRYGFIDLLPNLRFEQTRVFRNEIIEDVKTWQQLEPEFFPKSLSQHFTQAQAQAEQYRHLTPKRRFQAYTVGLPRTGTTTLYTLFKNFRAANEFMEQETISRIVNRYDGTLSPTAFCEYLVRRDREGGLEMDSASFNHFYLDFLTDLYPHARFIFLIREPISWMNSYLKMLMRWRRRFEEENKDMPQWMTAYGRMLFGDFSWSMIQSEGSVKHSIVKHSMEPLADSLLKHWASANQRILDLLPPECSLIVKTHELSSKRQAIADFLQIPLSRLTPEYHANACPDGHDLFAGIPSSVFYQRLGVEGERIVSRFF